jgi:hypothetical protein
MHSSIKDTHLGSLVKASLVEHVPNVKDCRKRKHRNQKEKHDRKVRRMVYSQIARIRKASLIRFSYQLPSPTDAAISPPASQGCQPLQQDQEAYENETRRFENVRSKIRLRVWLRCLAQLPQSSLAQRPSRPPLVLQLEGLQPHRYLKRSRG